MMIEYKVISYSSIPSQNICNRLGFEGWLLTTIIFDRDVHNYYAYFVREVKDEPDVTAACHKKTPKTYGKHKPKQ